METDPTRMCKLLVGLPEVTILGIGDVAGEALVVKERSRVILYEVGHGTLGSRSWKRSPDPDQRVVVITLQRIGRAH